MATIKRCIAQLSLSGSWGSVHLQPGMDVDLDRELAPARAEVLEKGQPGTDGYVAPRPGAPAFTLRDGIAGREDCFVDVPKDSAATRKPKAGIAGADGE
jgi:hypothetical protein